MPLAHPVQTKSLDVGYLDGEAYEIRVHGHRIRVDQPAGLGDDSAQRIRPAAASGCSPYSAARTAAQPRMPRCDRMLAVAGRGPDLYAG